MPSEIKISKKYSTKWGYMNYLYISGYYGKVDSKFWIRLQAEWYKCEHAGIVFWTGFFNVVLKRNYSALFISKMNAFKSQITKLKFQINPKKQCTKLTCRSFWCRDVRRRELMTDRLITGTNGLSIDNWNLDFVCNLLFGAWNFFYLRTQPHR